MRVVDLVDGLTQILAVPDVPDPQREARRIVADMLEVPGWWPALHGDDIVELTPAQAAKAAAVKRAAGAPLAYVLGRAPFRHLMLDVDDRVLIPRLETELIVDLVMKGIGPQTGGTAIDLGTGSGAIALSLATECAFDRVIGTDVSADAIHVAVRNQDYITPSLSTRIEFRVGSWFAPVRNERARVIVSNPPYIAYDEAPALPISVRSWEPPVALYSEDGGMAATVTVVQGAADILLAGGLLALEVDERRAALAANLISDTAHYAQVTVHQDLTGRDRFVTARRRA